MADRVVQFSYDCLSANIQIFFSYSTTSPFIQKTNKQNPTSTEPKHGQFLTKGYTGELKIYSEVSLL